MDDSAYSNEALTHSLEKRVEITAGYLAAMNDLATIEKTLISRGFQESEIRRLLLLIPSAFAKGFYESEEIEFPKTFFSIIQGQLIEKSYSDEPIYSTALNIFQKWKSGDKFCLIHKVIDWSSEANGIKQAEQKGFHPTSVGPVQHNF